MVRNLVSWYIDILTPGWGALPGYYLEKENNLGCTIVHPLDRRMLLIAILLRINNLR